VSRSRPDVTVQRPVWRQVLGDVRWSFSRPYTWLSGVAFNLALSLAWLAAVPLTGRPHRDWAIVVGSYFAVFILADVTTTNVLGADAQRVRLGLQRRIPLRRILLVKNLTLLLLVGLPTLVATGIITINSEPNYRLILTLPGVAFPILTWIGVGNIISVLLPVSAAPLRQRWQQRHQLRPTLRWLAALLVPYGLLGAVDPVGRLPGVITRHLGFLPHTLLVRGLVLTSSGLGVWGLGTAIALAIARRREIRLDDLTAPGPADPPNGAAVQPADQRQLDPPSAA
jgi:hypothetical protein